MVIDIDSPKVVQKITDKKWSGKLGLTDSLVVDDLTEFP